MWQTMQWGFLAFLGSMVATDLLAAGDQAATPESGKVIVGDGVELHYVECGTGVPVVFIHGGLEDYSLWEEHVRAFGETYRAIAYSRRYNFPNINKLRTNHSAAVEAEDLAALMGQLDLGRSHIVGFSYGGCTALFLALKHPELVRTLTLAEPALVPWLAELSAPHTEEGKRVLADYRERLVKPVRLAFDNGDPEGAVRLSLDYLVRKGMYDESPELLRSLWMRNAREFEAIFTSEDGLSAPEREQVRSLKVPTLLLAGRKSAPSCRLVDAELQGLLSRELWQRVEFQDATHAMWIDNPEGCRKAVLEFLRGK